MYAKVNKSNFDGNKLFPKSETIKVLIWVGGITLTMTSVLTQKVGFKTDYETRNDVGAAVTVNVPFKW